MKQMKGFFMTYNIYLMTKKRKNVRKSMNKIVTEVTTQILMGVNDSLSDIFKDRKMRTRENYKIKIVKDDIIKKIHFTVYCPEKLSLPDSIVLHFSNDS
jgi:hypothetical protein